jgi:hypothetical protein
MPSRSLLCVVQLQAGGEACASEQQQQQHKQRTQCPGMLLIISEARSQEWGVQQAVLHHCPGASVDQYCCPCAGVCQGQGWPHACTHGTQWRDGECAPAGLKQWSLFRTALARSAQAPAAHWQQSQLSSASTAELSEVGVSS